MGENIEVKDVQKTEYLDKNGLDMLWAKVKENTHNQVEVERNRAVAKENSIVDTKADKSALANEVTRATGAESGLQAAIETKANITDITELNQNVYQLKQQVDTKADALALSNYVLTTALDKQIDTLNTAISAKADTTALEVLEAKVVANTTAINNIGKSNGIPYDTSITNYYQTDKPFYIKCDNDHTAYINPYSGIKVANSDTSYVNITPSIMKLSDGNASCEINEYLGGMQCLSGTSDDSKGFRLGYDGLRIGEKSSITQGNNGELISISIPYGNSTSALKVSPNDGIKLYIDGSQIILNTNGISLPNGDNNHVLTSNSSTIDITEYAKKTELPTVPTKTSQLTNDSNFMQADEVDHNLYTLNGGLIVGVKNNGQMFLNPDSIQCDDFILNSEGIIFTKRHSSEVPTADGSFIDIDNYALKSQVTALEQTVTDNTTALEGKQDKGNYIPYTANGGMYEITSPISVAIKNKESITITNNRISISGSDDPESIDIDRNKLMFSSGSSGWTKYDINGITSIVYSDCLATSDGSFKPISDFVLSSAYNEKIAALEARIAALEAKYPEATA